MKCTNKAAKLSAVFAAATALAMAVPAYAFADEGGGIEAILPKMNEFIPMLVAFIQAFVFAILSASYINMAIHAH